MEGVKEARHVVWALPAARGSRSPCRLRIAGKGATRGDMTIRAGARMRGRLRIRHFACEDNEGNSTNRAL